MSKQDNVPGACPARWVAALVIAQACAGPQELPTAREISAQVDLAPHPAPAAAALLPAAGSQKTTGSQNATGPESAVADESGTLELDLPRAIEIALTESPDLSAAEARVAVARAGLREAQAQFLPTVSVDLSYLRADAPSLYLFRTIDAGQFLPGTDFNDPGAFSNWGAGVGLHYDLYNGGRDRLAEGIAAETIELERLQQLVAENALVAAVIDTWYAVRSAREQVATARASVATVAAQMEELRARMDEGLALESDVLALEVRRTEALELELRARNADRLAEATLRQLLGLGAERELAWGGAETVPLDLPADAVAALSAALAQRPELAAADGGVNLAKQRTALADSAIRPRVELFARGWRDAPEVDFDDSRDNWMLGVALHWDLFAGTRGAQQDRARAQLDEQSRTARKVQLAVEHDVTSAWLHLDSARARLEVASSAVTHARSMLSQVEALFENEAVTVTRFLEAELMNTQARMRYTQATFDVGRASANLVRAVGGFVAAGDRVTGEEE